MRTKKNKFIKNPLGNTKGIFCFKGVLLLFMITTVSFVFSQPKIEIAYAKKNFGIVKRGELIKLEYVLMNKGNEPLIITNAEVSCSCTTVDYPKQPLSPNQSATVIVSFDTKTVYDRQDRIVLLSSNDPKSPTKIRYKGIVKRK
ncbi:MAG: DUF1573 domain-containing protein [Bacteroidota bacterium]